MKRFCSPSNSIASQFFAFVYDDTGSLQLVCPYVEVLTFVDPTKKVVEVVCRSK